MTDGIKRLSQLDIRLMSVSAFVRGTPRPSFFLIIFFIFFNFVSMQFVVQGRLVSYMTTMGNGAVRPFRHVK